MDVTRNDRCWQNHREQLSTMFFVFVFFVGFFVGFLFVFSKNILNHMHTQAGFEKLELIF